MKVDTGAAPPAVLLEFDRLSVGYRAGATLVHAVSEVTLSVTKGQTVGLVGESGSGKSTIAAAILRLLPANASVTGGAIRFAGENLLALSETDLDRRWRWRRLAMVFQKSLVALSPVHRVGAQFADVLHQHEPGLSAGHRRGRIEQVVNAVNLPARVERAYPFELSGGMLQRALIAMALLCNPPFLILDEATTALDVITQSQILHEVNRLRAEFGLTMLVISHDVGVINATADAVAVLYAGQLMEVAPTASFFAAPAHPYARALVASVPKLTGPRSRVRGIPGTLPDLGDPPPGCRFAPRCPHASARCREPVPMYDLGAGRTVRCVLFAGAPVVAP